MNSHQTRVRILTSSLALLLVVLLLWTFSNSFFNRPEVLLDSVAKLGSSIEGIGDEKRREFNGFVERANALKNERLSRYKSFDFFNVCLVCSGMVITSGVSLVVAWKGNQLNEPNPPLPATDGNPRPRSNMAIAVAMLTAVAAAIQGVGVKVDNVAKTNREIAFKLKDETDQAKKRFAKPGLTPEEATEIIADLDGAIMRAT